MTQAAVHGTITIPEASTHQPPTTLQDCDVAVADLVENAKPWFEEEPGESIGLLERLNDS